VKVIAIASRKGGAGKSTLAAHMAVVADREAPPVLCVDMDPQGSLAFWHNLRGAETPILAQTDTGGLAPILEAARADGIRYVICDTPPHNRGAMVEAARLSDVVIMPSRPAAFDIAALVDGVDTMASLGKRPLIVWNSAPARRAMEAATVTEARAAMEAMPADQWEGQITARVAFAHALASGEAVTEFEPTGQAAMEVSRLWKTIKQRLGD